MRSMTGFGRGRCEVAGRRLVVEIRSVNHRFLELKQRLPWADAYVEQQVAQAVRRRVERGALALQVRDEGGGEVAPEVTVDVPLARAYARALASLQELCGVAAPVSVELLAAQPGVLVVGGAPLEAEALWQALAPGVARALDELVASREREGAALAAELVERAATVRRIGAEVAALAASTPDELRRRLEERLARLAPSVAMDPQRLAQEVALLADKADVAEEVSRLDTHLDELGRLVAGDAASGRRLDFLAQELHREVNTLGAKSQRAEIAQRVIAAKVEVERLREQVQNVE